MTQHAPQVTSGAGRRGPGQLDPSDKDFADYVIQIHRDSHVEATARVIVTNPDSRNEAAFGFAKGKEYWKIDGSATFSSDGADRIVVMKIESDWPAVAGELPFQVTNAAFVCEQAANWQTDSNSADWVDEVGSGLRASLQSSGGVWSGTLEWVKPAAESYVFDGIGTSAAVLEQNSPGGNPRYYTVTIGTTGSPLRR